MGIDLVVPCTKRKHGQCAPELAFRSMPPVCAEAMAEAWHTRALQSSEQTQAQELYCGVGWASSLKAFDAATRLESSTLFVISAGFGLMQLSDRLPHYSATFAEEADQIARNLREDGSPIVRHQAWWRAINARRGLGTAPLSTLLNPTSRCLVAVGVQYLLACTSDLNGLASQRPDNLYIVCVGASQQLQGTALARCLLPFDIHIQDRLSGPRSTLNQRTAEWLLKEVIPHTGWERREIAQFLKKLSATTPRQSHTLRRKVSDEELMMWIRQELLQNPKWTLAQLLVICRRNDIACEQSRFSALAKCVRQNLEIESLL